MQRPIRELLASHEAASSPSVADLVDTRLHLANAFERGKQFDEAERTLLAALQLGTDRAGGKDRIELVRQHLHGFYVRRGRPADAARYDKVDGTAR